MTRSCALPELSHQRTWLTAGVCVCLLFFSLPGKSAVPEYEVTLVGGFDAVDARQGVAVDADHFFAVSNTRITMHDKVSGEALKQWDGGPDDGSGRLVHLDGAMVKDGLLYAAHSNYPGTPMTSSVEIWRADTLEHLRSHSFGVLLGSLTWLDYHAGYWWGTFANYDLVQTGEKEPYGTTRATTLVKLDDNFNVLQGWLFPPALHARFTPMSNSGGSWGPDGYLYITGHDHPEVYVVQVPEQGSEVEWLATVKVPPIEGQGIAWDRTSGERLLWGILRRESKVFSFTVPEITQIAEPHPGGPLITAPPFHTD